MLETWRVFKHRTNGCALLRVARLALTQELWHAPWIATCFVPNPFFLTHRPNFSKRHPAGSSRLRHVFLPYSFNVGGKIIGLSRVLCRISKTTLFNFHR